MGLNTQKRGRPGIKPSIKRLITSWAVTEHRDMERLQLAALLTDEIQRIGEKTPAEDTLVKMISDARNQEVSPLEDPWHLGTLENTEYSLPNEAIPYILRVQNWITESGKRLGPVSIRQARWIARLYGIIEKQRGWKKSLERSLWKVSTIYAAHHQICDLSHTDVDTGAMDKLLLKGEREFTLGTVYANKDLENAFSAALYQSKGLGTAKHYLEFLREREAK